MHTQQDPWTTAAQGRDLDSANEDTAAWRQSRGAELGYPSRLARRRPGRPITQPPVGYTAFGRWPGAAPLGGQTGSSHRAGPFPGFWEAEGRDPQAPRTLGREGKACAGLGRGREAEEEKEEEEPGGQASVEATGACEETRHPEQWARQSPKGKGEKKGKGKAHRTQPRALCISDTSYGKTPTLQTFMHGKGGAARNRRPAEQDWSPGGTTTSTMIPRQHNIFSGRIDTPALVREITSGDQGKGRGDERSTYHPPLLVV